MMLKAVIKESNGEEIEGWFELDEEKINLSLKYNNKLISKQADDFFSALCLIRKELEKENIHVICNGASKDVFPSPMIRDMGDGDQAYRLTLGKPANMDDLVNIFEVDRANYIESSVDEQEQYYETWLLSKKTKS